MTQRKKRSRRLRRGRQQAFTGRHDQLALFREQLTLAGDDDRRRDVLNVYGQGGMGKSTLLNEFVRIAGDMSALAAITDHNEEDIPSAMARLATGLEEAGGDEAAAAFKTFNKRYDTYRQKRGELQADPKAPDGLAGLFGRAVAQTGFKVARNAAPGADFVVGLVEEPLTEQAGLWAEYVRRKLGDRDDVQLVLEPEAVLTPLFAAALEQLAAERRVALLFDTYERTSPALDGWLRDTLDGRHGDLPENLIVVIAGQYMLNHNAWANLLDTVAPLPLDPFAEEEARDYLTGKGITNERVVAVILALSDRMPLLLATLAAGAPQDPDQVGDASGTAVECFLKWVDDPARRALALDAALPRRLNRDVVETLGGDAPGFDWLITTPFVQRLRDDGGWVYHDVVRRQMLAHKRAESPAGWTALHERLAAHYRAARDEINPDRRAGLRESAWRAAALEELYHRLCARPGRELGAGLNETVVMLEENRAHGIQWAAVLEAAGEDANHKTLRDWGMDLGQGLRAYLDIEQDEEIAVKAFSQLLDSKLLEPVNQTTVLARRASSYRYMGRDEKALADYSRIIELKPDDARAFTSRGNVFQEIGRYEEALADFSRAIELKPDDTRPIIQRGEFYQKNGKLEEALADYSRAIELKPDDTWTIIKRGEFYQKNGKLEEALADYSRVIELKPDDIWPIIMRGAYYRDIGWYEEALADYSRAIELNPEHAWAIAGRGETYRQMGRHEEALADFSRAIELYPEFGWAIAGRGVTYRQMGRYDEALADFSRALDLNPEYGWANASRGETYRQMGRYEEALVDLNRAIDLNPEYGWAIASRGETCLQIGEYEKALADFDRAIELDPEEDWCLYLRAITHRRLHSAEWADDLNEAVRLATAARDTTPAELMNVFNLALYHVARGDADPAEAFYREGIAALPHEGLRRDALNDLAQHLSLFPDDSLARQMQALLVAAWGDLAAGSTAAAAGSA